VRGLVHITRAYVRGTTLISKTSIVQFRSHKNKRAMSFAALNASCFIEQFHRERRGYPTNVPKLESIKRVKIDRIVKEEIIRWDTKLAIKVERRCMWKRLLPRNIVMCGLRSLAKTTALNQGGYT